MPKQTSDQKNPFHSVAGAPLKPLSRPAPALDHDTYRPFVADAGLTATQEASPPSAALTFDPKTYLEFVDDCELTGAQKIEFLQTLWSIMVAFVDLGFGISPLQHIINKVLESESSRVLDSQDISNSKQISVAGAFNASAQEKDS